jgi:hypothetical protein
VLTGVANPGFPDDGAVSAKGQDLFAARFSPSGTRLWSRLVGGSSTEQAQGVGFDDAGRAVIVGSTNSFDFPTTWDASDAVYDGGGSPGDGVLVVLDGVDGALAHGTFFGGNGYDDLRAIAVASPCRATIAGVGNSTQLATGSPSFGGAVSRTRRRGRRRRPASARGAYARRRGCVRRAVGRVLGRRAETAEPHPRSARTAPRRRPRGHLRRRRRSGAPIVLGACPTAFDAATLEAVVPLGARCGRQHGASAFRFRPRCRSRGFRCASGSAVLAPSEPLGIAASNGVEWRSATDAQ